jgi:hypothetical protein
MSTTFQQTGGARLGWFNATWPLAKLSATPERVSLSCLGRYYEFPKGSLVRLRKHAGIFSTGLRIEHREVSAPQRIVFWTFDFRRVTDGLKGLGYEVEI